MVNLKPVLLTVVLIFSSCVSQQRLVENGQIYRDMTKPEMAWKFWYVNQFQHPFAVTAFQEYDASRQSEIIASATREVYYAFVNVTEPSNPPLIGVHHGNGFLHSWHSQLDQARAALNTPRTATLRNSSQNVARTMEPQVELDIPLEECVLDRDITLARTGSSYAQLNLAEKYGRRACEEYDLVLAYAWMTVSADSGLGEAREKRVNFRSSLTQNQVHDATERASQLLLSIAR